MKHKYNQVFEKANYAINLLKHYIQKHSFLVTCEVLGLAHGRVNFSESVVPSKGYPVDTLPSFTCNHGYNISGFNSSICQTSGNWNQQTPRCSQGNRTLIK